MKRKNKIAAGAALGVLTLPAVASAQTYAPYTYTNGNGESAPIGGAWQQGLAQAQQFGLPNAPLYAIILNILMWLLGIFGIVGVIGFVISGLMYLTAAGDSGQIDKAKTAMLYSIIGVIVGLMGLVIITAVNAMLGAYSPQF